MINEKCFGIKLSRGLETFDYSRRFGADKEILSNCECALRNHVDLLCIRPVLCSVVK